MAYIGKSGVYIEGTLTNGNKNRIAMRLTFREQTKISTTTPFLQELIGILVGVNIAQRYTNNVRAFTECKLALAKVKDAITIGSKSTSHLPYGSLISAIKRSSTSIYYGMRKIMASIRQIH